MLLSTGTYAVNSLFFILEIKNLISTEHEHSVYQFIRLTPIMHPGFDNNNKNFPKCGLIQGTQSCFCICESDLVSEKRKRWYFHSVLTEIYAELCARGEEPDLLSVLTVLASGVIPGLPPGGGIQSK